MPSSHFRHSTLLPVFLSLSLSLALAPSALAQSGRPPAGAPGGPPPGMMGRPSAPDSLTLQSQAIRVF
ncbi:hypothetical protein, partial [Gemmatimonas sp.]|uniref:hypothetical protein n=1 Tax=Gemmatimonas sp. TaxID=1962908 RepID=UPI0035685115